MLVQSTAGVVAPSVTDEVEELFRANRAAGAGTITLLGTRTNQTVAPPVRKRGEEEDIFASMGLSSICEGGGGGKGKSVVRQLVGNKSTWQGNVLGGAAAVVGVGLERGGRCGWIGLGQ